MSKEVLVVGLLVDGLHLSNAGFSRKHNELRTTIHYLLSKLCLADRTCGSYFTVSHIAHDGAFTSFTNVHVRHAQVGSVAF